MNQTIFDTAAICHLLGVRHAVFSPGSRNAPLSISFNQHKGIETFVIVDERSAGFIALGIAQQTKRPVVLCCTSGTALLNYGPAIAEAFYQQIPLVILSADRPPEWIDQWDGQTIRQQNLFSQYTKFFGQMPADVTSNDAKWEYNRKLNQAIIVANSGIKGPTHLNIPFREPFYPTAGQHFIFSEHLSPLNLTKGDFNLHPVEQEKLLSEWNQFERKMIIIGHHDPFGDAEIQILNELSFNQNIPIVADVISNGHPLNSVIQHHDLLLNNSKYWKELAPDLVLHLGKSLISKNLKLFLRSQTVPVWQIDPNPTFADPFQSLTKIIETTETEALVCFSKGKSQEPIFINNWINCNQLTANQLKKQPLDYSEAAAFQQVMDCLPDNCDLHLANSMPVRYANFFSCRQSGIQVYANRGTSGIDGTNSTAVGHAFVTQRKVVLLTGDLSFLYDRNAFLHEYDLSNLYVIVFNNFGGGIFDLIPGPAQLPVNLRQKHFTTPHNKDMKKSAEDAGFAYLKANDEVTLQLALIGFFESGTKPRLLEIQTDPAKNIKAFTILKQLAHD